MTENQQKIADKVKSVIADRLGVDLEDVKPEANLEVDLGADSLDKVDVMVEIEREFTISIPDDKAENFKTVQDFVDYVVDVKG